MVGYPNAQNNAAGAIPVWNAGGGGILPPFPGAAFKGYQKLTGLSSAQALTVPSGATFAQVTPSGANVNYLPSGTPTATDGMPLWATSAPLNISSGLSDYRFIQQSATATLHILYWG